MGKLRVAARVLATYLVPGCVGRGVRLGSESSSGAGAAGAAGGVWKSGNLEISGPGTSEIWGPTNFKDTIFQNLNPLCPKCRQGLD